MTFHRKSARVISRRQARINMIRRLSSMWLAAGLYCLLVLQTAAASTLAGNLTDPEGGVVAGATIRVLALAGGPESETSTDAQGRFLFADLDPGKYRIVAEFSSFQPVARTISLSDKETCTESLEFIAVAPQSESVTVAADVNETDIFAPDPGEQVFTREELLEANPGRAGPPFSIPGYPAETASGGVKAPQYFAPGVAGDHGEPIAQFIAVGDYRVPNNLSANAHGNGYADPNILIPQVVESAEIDGGAFDVREGNHAVNLAETYGLSSHLDPFFTLNGDRRDIDVAAGLSGSQQSWMAFEGSFGNGLLSRPEHRQQYKFNGERIFHLGEHRLTLVGIGYYGQSYVPGLVPISRSSSAEENVLSFEDTIDPRQKDQTHTALVALSDSWQLGRGQQLEISGFFRTYNLSLFSDFGAGLIRQSEFRTVGGASTSYVNKISEHFSLLGGLDYDREAPRRDDLDRYGFFDPARPAYYGPSTPVDRNNVTIGSVTPYAAVEGGVAKHLRYYLGWRRDEISLDNLDLLNPENSFHKLAGINSPKATLSYLPGDSRFLPLLSLSFGQTFFTEDPRTGLGSVAGTPVSRSHSYQLTASKTTHQTNIRLTLGHVTSSAELAKIDPDTGLQLNQGPSRLRFMTIAIRRNFGVGSVDASVSKADARDLDSGDPTPEAPRTIVDLLGTVHKLPLKLQAKGEFEFVARKPLGTGCQSQDLNAECFGTAVTEFRSAVVRSFFENRLDLGLNFRIARGYTGQTLESIYPSDLQQIVGVRNPSNVSFAFTYRFRSSD